MNVIYKVYLNELEGTVDFPKLNNNFKREIVEQGMDNPHLIILKWLLKPQEKGITYSIGKIKN